MLRNYLTIALRNITRELSFSAINVLGLALGMGSCMVILLWAAYEWSYDDFHPNKDLVVQIERSTVFEDRVETRRSFTYRGAEEMLKYPQVEKAAVARVSGFGYELLATDSSKIRLQGSYVTPGYLDILQFPLLRGNREHALDDTYSIVLTESAAKALFGSADPINKTVRWESKHDLRVTAVLKEIPRNSSIKFAYLLPLSLFEQNTSWAKDCMNDWDCDWFHVYLELKPGTDLKAFNEAILDLPAKFAGQHPAAKEQMFLYPMDRWHLHNNFENGVESSEDRADYVKDMTLLGLIILVVACINFMNLATARSARRGREVGIRKVAGSSRSQLIFQFMGESIAISSIAFVVALGLVELLLPLIRNWMDVPLTIDHSSWQFWFACVSCVLITGVVAGSYPAIYLSAFKPIKVLTSKTSIGRVTSLPRKILVVTQFGMSFLLILGAIAIRQQVQLGLDRQLGFNKEQLITIPDNEELARNYPLIKQKLLSSGVANAVVKTNSPVTDIYEVNYLTWDANPGAPVECVNIFTDYDYTRTLRIKMVHGRDFLPEVASDTAAVIFNETAANIMGFENPIGQEVFIGPQRLTIIGIMQDVMMTDPFDNIDPLYMVLWKDWPALANTPNITIRLTDVSRIEEAAKIVTAFTPSNPFDYTFVEEDHEEKFGRITLQAEMTNVFAVLALIIACMGLFGLATFTAEQRQKEMSIRKVLGASVSRIMVLLSTDFTRLIILSFVIFAPVGAWAINGYLEGYAYRIQLSWWMFAVGALSIVVVTLGIIGREGWRAANVNPVESLRNE